MENEFLGVFPKELPGMPLNREVEFYIDLVHNIKQYPYPHIAWR